MSVLFADLVGYTTLSESLDHESVKLLTDRCLTRLAREVERFGGYVDQYIGDNVMAVFGAPTAHEDDPERAVRAGWGMQRAMEELNTSVGAEFGVELALRVGVNTGEALAGRVGGQYTVVGDVVNTAARLQTSAPVGGVLIGERTRRSAAAAARFREVGPLALKGKAEPVRAYEVVEVLEPARHESLPGSRPPLIGRGSELQRLRALFAEVDSSGRPHTVTVIGEAGVGKTRVVEELRADLERASTGLRVLAGRLPPVRRGQLRRSRRPAAGRERVGSRRRPGVGSRQAPANVRAGAAGRTFRRPRGAAGGGAGPTSPRCRASGTSGKRGRRSSPPRGASSSSWPADGPLLIVWEDVHWADEGTLELIEHLGRWLEAPVLQVCVARDDLLDERPGWGITPRVGEHDLRRAALVRAHAGADRRAREPSRRRRSRSPRRSPPVRGATRCSRRRSSTASSTPAGSAGRSCRRRCRACSRRAWTRCRRANAGCSATRRSPARRSPNRCSRRSATRHPCVPASTSSAQGT